MNLYDEVCRLAFDVLVCIWIDKWNGRGQSRFVAIFRDYGCCWRTQMVCSDFALRPDQSCAPVLEVHLHENLTYGKVAS